MIKAYCRGAAPTERNKSFHCRAKGPTKEKLFFQRKYGPEAFHRACGPMIKHYIIGPVAL